MRLRSGELRHRISIERQQKTQDPVTGEQEVNWVLLSIRSAAVVPVSGREFLQSQATQAQITARFKLRKTDVTSEDRIVFRGGIYNIHAVLPDPDSGLEYINLMASQGVNEGE
ncbi:phage head closure protein [uncultured Microbulbifer sp.]|uniref:phage head closure protein n=1 Tax=uncultured Microbulbifer sp. TaxID=348147 RepID=UPI0025D6FEC2|nr:phage head closure protein [uncultured Microbulbifer sp.]